MCLGYMHMCATRPYTWLLSPCHLPFLSLNVYFPIFIMVCIPRCSSFLEKPALSLEHITLFFLSSPSLSSEYPKKKTPIFYFIIHLLLKLFSVREGDRPRGSTQDLGLTFQQRTIPSFTLSP